MENSNEDIVTDILTKREILKKQDSPEVFENAVYASNPQYDLSLYIKHKKEEPREISRFGNKYLFVK